MLFILLYYLCFFFGFGSENSSKDSPIAFKSSIAGSIINTGIPRRNHFTPIFIKKGDNVWWDLLKFRVVFAISGDFLAINLTTPNMRYGFSCSS